MNHPGGFTLRDGSVVDVHPFSALFANSFFWHELIHMYLGGFMVTGFLIAAAYAWGWLRGRRGRYHGTALVRPSTCSAGTTAPGSSTGSRSRGCCRCWPSTSRTPR